MEVRTTINIPSDGGYFEGHFPGRPILPGVTQIILVQEAIIKEAGEDVPVTGITHTRLRQIVLPGDTLELVVRRTNEHHMRFDLKRENVLVTNGEFYLGAQESTELAMASLEQLTPVSECPAMDKLLPHRAPMRFLTSVISETSDRIICEASIPPGCALVDEGYVSAIAGIEASAQAAAAWEALQRQNIEGREAARVGYLVAIRDVAFYEVRIPADTVLRVIVDLEAAVPPLSHYRVALFLGDRPLLQGTIATFLTEDEI